MNSRSVRKILIAEDNPSQVSVLKLFCEQLDNVLVRIAYDGVQACDISNETTALDLAIVDLHMPNMDGIQLVEKLARRPQLPALILISGNYSDLLSTSKQAAQELGFTRIGQLTKPIDKDELKLEIANLLDVSASNFVVDSNLPLIDIVTGLARNQFCAYYQAIYDLTSKKAVQIEALARWIHPQHGVIPPGSFIATLEHEGMISLLTRRIVQTSLDLLIGLADAGDLKVSINLSRKLLVDDEFIEWLIDQVQLRRIAFSRIVLEITETMAFSNAGHTLAALIRLRMRGFELSLDDFGTGHTTLEHIKNLPITELKFDRSIVKDIHKNNRSQNIISGMAKIADGLGFRMVAEGIDNSQDLNYLRKHHHNINLQGFLLCKPVPASALEGRLALSEDVGCWM